MKISILQGSETGMAAYVQVCNPTTNENGLVSFPIGYEVGFDAIDWSAGPYYLKTETDVTGGTAYTIEGISQLLSVPYALHAKTAESVTGIITETDPVFGASVASGITGVDTLKWNNKQDQLTAGTNISIVGTTINATYPVHYIGESYGGGIVFWVDASGQHGLIAATADQSNGITWYNDGYIETGATLDAVYAGMSNTNTIIAKQGAGTYAAQICAEYSVTVNNEYYDDWYLPSKYELNLLYLQKTAIGGFAGAYYWSSSEFIYMYAYLQYFGSGYQDFGGKEIHYYVRAIRAF